MKEIVEFLKRWAIIERLCGFSIRENVALKSSNSKLEKSSSNDLVEMSSRSVLSLVDLDQWQTSSKCRGNPLKRSSQ